MKKIVTSLIIFSALIGLTNCAYAGSGSYGGGTSEELHPGIPLVATGRTTQKPRKQLQKAESQQVLF